MIETVRRSEKIKVKKIAPNYRFAVTIRLDRG